MSAVEAEFIPIVDGVDRVCYNVCQGSKATLWYTVIKNRKGGDAMVRARKGRVEPALHNNEETNPVSL